ncbi:MAG: sigma-54-dependent Fis family transcriptional regulator [Nitrospirae bacterium]|nr:MAG: sigma-54-dependent Fis family transcriptional regulator [Nitrospirota bacterium]
MPSRQAFIKIRRVEPNTIDMPKTVCYQRASDNAVARVVIFDGSSDIERPFPPTMVWRWAFFYSTKCTFGKGRVEAKIISLGLNDGRMTDRHQRQLATLTAILRRPGDPVSRIADALSYLEKMRASARQEEPRESRDMEEGKPGQPLSEAGHSDAARYQEQALGKLVGTSPAMQAVYDAVRHVGTTDATVLIRGESGTGKELIARAIHAISPRREHPFVPVHCAALPESLIESALFGYEQGAFTGALRRKAGKLDQAAGGTLFLDEVGDIPLSTQVKLLRVLQEREYERVGGLETLQADIRVIAATHRNLEAMVAAGEFREDLYYRLNVVPIELPPLRERKEDIPLLIEYFLRRLNQRYRREVKVGQELLALMSAYHWPGNVRELQNCMERVVVMAEREIVTLATIPAPLRSYFHHMQEAASRDTAMPPPGKSRTRASLPTELHGLERERLKHTLDRVGWVMTKAARELGLTPRQVAYKIKKYGLSEHS